LTPRSSLSLSQENKLTFGAQKALQEQFLGLGQPAPALVQSETT
jgi:hypothetical protein